MVAYLDTYMNCTIFPQYIIASCWKHNWSLKHLMSSPNWWNWSAEKILSFLVAVRLQVRSITVLIAPSIVCDRWSEGFSPNSFQYISPEMQFFYWILQLIWINTLEGMDSVLHGWCGCVVWRLSGNTRETMRIPFTAYFWLSGGES
jgi:hypothetical protein